MNRIIIENIEDNTPELEVKLIRAVNAMQDIVNSDIFKEEFLRLRFTNSGGFTNQEILNKLRRRIEIDIRFYYRDSPVLGMADYKDQRISFNEYHFNNHFSSASTLAHELMHLLGFKHEGSKEHTSVPYATGTLVKSLLNRFGHRPGKDLKTFRPWYYLWLFKTTKWVN